MKHLFFIRLIAGLVFLVFSTLHFASPENFKHILQTSDLALFTRLTALAGWVTIAVALYVTMTIMQFEPSQLPDRMTEKPFSPLFFIPIIIFLMSLYFLILGADPWNIDRLRKKREDLK